MTNKDGGAPDDDVKDDRDGARNQPLSTPVTPPPPQTNAGPAGPTDEAVEETTKSLIRDGLNWRQIAEKTGRSEATIRRIATKYNLKLTPINRGGQKAARDVGEAKAERPRDYAAGESLKALAVETATLEATTLSRYVEVGKHATDRWGGLAKQKLMTIGELLETGMSYFIEYGVEIDRLKEDRDRWKELAHAAYARWMQARNRRAARQYCMYLLIKSGVTPTDDDIETIRSIVEAVDI